MDRYLPICAAIRHSQQEFPILNNPYGTKVYREPLESRGNITRRDGCNLFLVDVRAHLTACKITLGKSLGEAFYV